MIKRIIEFIRHGIWQKDDSGMAKGSWIIRPFKIIIYTVKGIGEHDIAVRSAALTFYTVLSMVPIAALIFGILKGFGYEDNLVEWIYNKFPDHAAIIEDTLFTFVRNMLVKTKGAVIAAVGIVVLLWSVIKVFGNMESAFNRIWEVRKDRSLARKFSDYVAVIFVAPILFVSSNSLLIAIRSSLSFLDMSWLVEILIRLASLVLIWLLFAFVYHVMPNTKVRFKGAIIAGIIAGTAFQVFQVAYFYIQGQLNTYNAIYGTFAAIPLLLVWLQVSWQILLTGSELSFAYQNIGRYEQEREAADMSVDNRRKVMLATMVTITARYMRNQGAVNSESVAAELNLPVRIIRDVLFDLESAGLVLAVRNDGDDKTHLYVPAKDVHEITVFDVVDSVDRCGKSHIDVDDIAELKRVGEVLDKMKNQANTSVLNVKLTDLI